MKEVFIDENNLVIGYTKIDLKYPIKKVEKLFRKYIVLLKIPPYAELGVEELNNVLCYDEKGKKCWQISCELPSDIISKEQIPYVDIQVIDGKLYATDFWGRKFNFDIKNGKLISVNIVR